SHEHRAPNVLPHETRDALRAVVIDLPLPSYIPESYAPDIEGRLALYQRIAGLRSTEEVEALAQETADRFGALPEALANLLSIVRLRIVGATAGIGAIRIEGGEVLITSEGRPFGERLLPRLPSGVRLGRNQIRMDRAALGEQWLAAIEMLLTLLAGARAPMAV
ncbi:MAG: TRCF domain-containing protein, partial [Chloroflexota bacterium]